MDFDELKACASIIQRHGASVEILLPSIKPIIFHSELIYDGSSKHIAFSSNGQKRFGP